MTLRLIEDWHRAWRWSSIRFLAMGGAIQAALITTPDKVQAHVPEPVLQALSIFAMFCIVAAGIGRITTTEPKPEDGVAKTQESLDVHKSNQ